MGFILLILTLWAIYAVILKQQLGKKFILSKSLIPLLLIAIISSICLGVNYLAAAIPNLNDGIGIHVFLAYWIIGEDNWSIQLFKNYFNTSVYVSILLTLIYSALTLVKK